MIHHSEDEQPQSSLQQRSPLSGSADSPSLPPADHGCSRDAGAEVSCRAAAARPSAVSVAGSAPQTKAGRREGAREPAAGERGWALSRREGECRRAVRAEGGAGRASARDNLTGPGGPRGASRRRIPKAPGPTPPSPRPAPPRGPGRPFAAVRCRRLPAPRLPAAPIASGCVFAARLGSARLDPAACPPPPSGLRDYGRRSAAVPGSKVQSRRGAVREMQLRFLRTLLRMVPTPPPELCRLRHLPPRRSEPVSRSCRMVPAAQRAAPGLRAGGMARGGGRQRLSALAGVCSAGRGAEVQGERGRTRRGEGKKKKEGKKRGLLPPTILASAPENLLQHHLDAAAPHRHKGRPGGGSAPARSAPALPRGAARRHWLTCSRQAERGRAGMPGALPSPTGRCPAHTLSASPSKTTAVCMTSNYSLTSYYILQKGNYSTAWWGAFSWAFVWPKSILKWFDRKCQALGLTDKQEEAFKMLTALPPKAVGAPAEGEMHHSAELDLMFPVGPFQLRLFYDYDCVTWIRL